MSIHKLGEQKWKSPLERSRASPQPDGLRAARTGQEDRAEKDVGSR